MVPYSPYATANDIPGLLTETESLIASSAAKGVTDAHLAPLRNVVMEGACLAINPAVTLEEWTRFNVRLNVTLATFELEVIWPMLEAQEGADVAAIA